MSLMQDGSGVGVGEGEGASSPEGVSVGVLVELGTISGVHVGEAIGEGVGVKVISGGRERVATGASMLGVSVGSPEQPTMSKTVRVERNMHFFMPSLETNYMELRLQEYCDQAPHGEIHINLA
jgi:hypothetical protein